MKAHSECLLMILLILPGVSLKHQGSHADANDERGPNTGILNLDKSLPRGSVRVILAKGLKPIPAKDKMPIQRGSILILDEHSTVSIVCADGPHDISEPGPNPCPCKEPCPARLCGDSSPLRMRPTRGPDTEQGMFPVVVSPRATKLLELRPAIRWTPIAGASQNTSYQVTLYGENMRVIFNAEVTGRTSLAYPDKTPALTPGQTYKVVVTAEGRSSEEDRAPGLGFLTFTLERARDLAREEQKIKERGLSSEFTRFLISTLYASEGLYAESISQLEALDKIAKEAAVARALGDSYAAIGLNREAIRNYLEALRIMDSDDLEAIALTQQHLAGSYENLGLSDKANAALEEAIKAYERLGDLVVIEQLRKQQRR